ncbi:hypothetical protein [Pseudolysinimonas sp.]|jgi:hypothetical protein|uniref:DUF6414 family protein n=1 Tax=Pseudolysinimonas sp. TaxID=2680009 RepID=UPI00378354B7
MVIRQVAASEFERLYNLLDGRDEIRVIDRADAAADAAPASRKSFVEFDGRVVAAGLGPLVDVLARFLPMLGFVEKLPNASVDIDAGTRESMAAFTALAGNQQQTSVTITVPGTLGFKVVAELKREYVISAEWDLDATAFVRVQRVLRDDEVVVVGDATGGMLAMVPAEKREELAQSLRSPQAKQLGLDAELEVSGPAVVVTPIAIFR